MGIAKFEIRRKCMVCGESFMAKTIESWYCSPRCSKIAYKRRRDEEIRHSKLDVIVRKIPKSQEYVKVSEAYALFGISKDTLYRDAHIDPHIAQQDKLPLFHPKEIAKPTHKRYNETINNQSRK